MPRLELVVGLFILGCTGTIVGGEGRAPTSTAEPTWPAHLLTSAEYNATAHDVLGTTARPADFFPTTSATEFDANVGVLSSLSAVQAEALFVAARTLSDEVLSTPSLLAKVVTCTPVGGELSCPRTAIAALGRRVFRRSLDADELDAFVAVYQQARSELLLEHPAALTHVLRVLLSSPSFFLRLERGGGALEPVALASRVSYLLWSSAPDDELLDAAEAGALVAPDALSRQVDRLLTDPRSAQFVSRFLGQWLGAVRLGSLSVDPRLHPEWTPAVASAVEAQTTTFLTSFITQRPWSDIFTAPHPALAGVAPLLAHDPPNVRRGFVTLPGFLAWTSHAERTSPTSRAKVILAALFCTDLTPPPGVVTDLPPTPAGQSAQTVRARLEAHRRAPTCAGCHNLLDPVGLSLEHFDPVGQYRTSDENQPIDASGTWQGVPFTDSTELLPLLAADTRLGACAPKKLLAYALRRSLVADDQPTVERLASSWAGAPLNALLKQVVQTPAFRGHPEEK
jgi:Protein of unknown function (DUF1592)/Protein of unknown function (DUF1588)/Protein of unknown function (DUF1595)/Protein of unknown function (DUF1585)/Protein of unknown function (DUF1587)